MSAGIDSILQPLRGSAEGKILLFKRNNYFTSDVECVNLSATLTYVPSPAHAVFAFEDPLRQWIGNDKFKTASPHQTAKAKKLLVAASEQGYDNFVEEGWLDYGIATAEERLQSH